MATLKNDLSLHNLTFEDAIELALDKSLWRLLAASGATHWYGACRIIMMMTMMNTLAASPSTGKLRGNVCNGVWAYQTNGLKAKIHYTSFPVASLQQVGDFPITSTQHYVI